MKYLVFVIGTIVSLHSSAWAVLPPPAPRPDLAQDITCGTIENPRVPQTRNLFLRMRFDAFYGNHDIWLRTPTLRLGPFVQRFVWSEVNPGSFPRTRHASFRIETPAARFQVRFTHEDWTDSGMNPGPSRPAFVPMIVTEGDGEWTKLACSFTPAGPMLPSPPKDPRPGPDLTCQSSLGDRLIQVSGNTATFTVYESNGHDRLTRHIRWPKQVGQLAIRNLTDGLRVWIESPGFRLFGKRGRNENNGLARVLMSPPFDGRDFGGDRFYHCQ